PGAARAPGAPRLEALERQGAQLFARPLGEELRHEVLRLPDALAGLGRDGARGQLAQALRQLVPLLGGALEVRDQLAILERTALRRLEQRLQAPGVVAQRAGSA